MADTKLQVRGEIDMEKFRAARTLGGSDTKFELRAMKPVRGGNLASSCIICLICIICVVCSARVAEEHQLEGLRPLPT